VSAFRSARSAIWLTDGAREAVHALKYAGLPKVAQDLAAVMARSVTRPVATALVPVPLDPRRQRERGYNQSLALAEALGERWDLPVADLLVRVRPTLSQTTLTPTARVANVAGAFRVRNVECGMRSGRGEDSAFPIPNSALILVDDVFTTGATLAECAQALAAAGATDISAVTFGRAAIPDFS
jgi:ComF family protein